MFFKNNKQLISLVIPIFLEAMLMNLLGFFDTFMISKFSTDSVVAIGNSATIIGIFTVLLNIAARGTNVIMSQYLGASQENNATKTLHSGIIFNLIFSLILVLIIELLSYQMLLAMRVDSRYLEEALSYLKLVTLGLPFLAMTNVFAATFRSYKKPKVLTITALISNLFNVILNYFLIFGIRGLFSPLGSRGAAIATLMSYILNFSLGLIFMHTMLHKKVFSLKIDIYNLKKLLEIGLPSALESFVYTACNMALMSSVNILDTTLPGLAAGRSYLNQMLGFVLMLSGAFGTANSILVGHFVGEGKPELAGRSTKSTAILCLPLVEGVVLILFLFGSAIFSIYSPNDPADLDKFNVALNEILKVLPYIFLLELGRSLNLIFVNALQASGDVIFPLINAIISMIIFMAIGSYFFGIVCNMGLLGIYLGCIIDECLRAFIMIIRWLSNKWQKKCLIEA